MKCNPMSKLLFVLLALTLNTLVFADTVWIDVRSSVEHAIDNIEGDARISYGDITEQVTVQFPDKNTPIRLYCRSGGRAGKALTALREAGYTDVENIGSIGDARTSRGISQ